MPMSKAQILSTAYNPASALSGPQHFYDAGPTTSSFTVIIDDPPLTLATFQEVSGLSVEIEVEEFAEGGENNFLHQVPVRSKFPNLVLKRGMSQDDYLYQWIKEAGNWHSVSHGALSPRPHPEEMNRREVTLVLWGGLPERAASMARTAGLPVRNPLRAWTFVDAFPVKWTAPDFSLSGDEFPIEELELAHSGFSRTLPDATENFDSKKLGF